MTNLGELDEEIFFSLARSYDIDNEGPHNYPGNDETSHDLNAVEELGVPEVSSLFSSSFALRRIQPLEFHNEESDPNIPVAHHSRTVSGGRDHSVPVYYGSRRSTAEHDSRSSSQKRGGSSFGGIYPGSFGFEVGHDSGEGGENHHHPNQRPPQSNEEPLDDTPFGNFGDYDNSDYSDRGHNDNINQAYDDGDDEDRE